MSLHSTEGNILNGLAGVFGATIAGLSHQLFSLGVLSEVVAQVGGMIVVTLTIINGLLMAHRNWRNRNK